MNGRALFLAGFVLVVSGAAYFSPGIGAIVAGLLLLFAGWETAE